MTIELNYLVMTTVLTALLWVPYTINTIAVRGLGDAVGYPDNPPPLAAWASRMKAAHYNAVENLVIFASLVLVAHVAGVSGPATIMSCQVYFWARVLHPISYTFAIPWVRTFSFVAGVGAQLCIAWQILSI